MSDRHHKLTIHGRGADVWGECSCELWAWTGNYVMPKGKRAKLREAHRTHVERATAYEEARDVRRQAQEADSAYGAALRDLRDRHPDEFEALLTRERTRRGLGVLADPPVKGASSG